MRKIYHLLLPIVALTAISAQATNYNIVVNGTSYSPAVVNATVGDQITIHASQNHPVVEVSESTWNADGFGMLNTGFGSHTNPHTFTVTTAGTIYYVCENHVEQFGMKGLINVSIATGIIDAGNITGLNIYPSIVTNGMFNVSSEGDMWKGATIELYSTNGQLMKSYLLRSESAKLRANISTGSYVAVVVKNNEAILRQRMVFVSE